MTLTEDIARLKSEIEQNSLKNAEDVERFRIQYISKKGFIPALFDRFKEVWVWRLKISVAQGI
jgi:phenylalanyl-tRNA synthetase alpha chain